MKAFPTAGAARIDPRVKDSTCLMGAEQQALKAVFEKFPETAGCSLEELSADVLFAYQLEFAKLHPLTNICADFVVADNPMTYTVTNPRLTAVILFAYGLAGETPYDCFSSAKGTVSAKQDMGIAVAQKGDYSKGKTVGLAILKEPGNPSQGWISMAAKSTTYKKAQVKESLFIDLYKAEKALISEIKACICLQSTSSPLIRRLTELGLDAAKRDRLNHYQFIAMLKQPKVANLLYPLVARELPSRLGVTGGKQLVAIKGPGLVPGGLPSQVGSYIYVNQSEISRLRIVP